MNVSIKLCRYDFKQRRTGRTGRGILTEERPRASFRARRAVSAAGQRESAAPLTFGCSGRSPPPKSVPQLEPTGWTTRSSEMPGGPPSGAVTPGVSPRAELRPACAATVHRAGARGTEGSACLGAPPPPGRPRHRTASDRRGSASAAAPSQGPQTAAETGFPGSEQPFPAKGFLKLFLFLMEVKKKMYGSYPFNHC